MRTVGLRIEPGIVFASVIEKRLRSTELKETVCERYASESELLDLLRRKAKDWSADRIVSAIGGRSVAQRSVVLPFGDRARIEKALPFELEDSLPFPLDDAVLDHVQLAKSTDRHAAEFPVLGLLVMKRAVRRHLELLGAAGIDPHAVAPSAAGLARMAATLVHDAGDGAILVIDGADLCLVRSGRPVAVRPFSSTGPTGGIEHVLHALETEHACRIERACLLSENEPLRSVLADHGVAIEQIAPEFNGSRAVDAISLGLALAGEVNLRKGEFAYRLEHEGSRRRRRTLLLAGGVVALIAAMNIGVKAWLVRGSYNRLDAEIRQVFTKTLPNTKIVGDPVRQLRMSLDDAKKRFGALGAGSSALDVMKTITDGIPKDVRVTFQEFLLEKDTLKLSGEASSFEAIDKMKAELLKAPVIADMQVQDTRMGVDNKVKFRFEIKLKQGM